jgi:hypothetical protein
MSDTTQGNAKKQKTNETTTEPTLQAARMESGGIADTSGRTSETQVSIPPTITYGLQDTHTTILPAIFWFSCTNLSQTTPLTLCLRLNSYNDIICGTTNIKASIPDQTPYMINRKIADRTYAAITSTNLANFPAFPDTIPEDGDPKCWYKPYWDSLYEYYTVLGVEYEIIYNNPRAGGRHNLVAYSVETDGTTQATRIPQDTPLRDLYGFKQVRYENVQCRDNSMQQPFAIIKGNYKPGQAKRDVSNDSDVKLWTRTGGATTTPTYREVLQLMHYAHPLALSREEDSALGHNLLVQVRMKYIVQFKQLKQSAKYPNTAATALVVPDFPNAANPYM